MPRSPASSRLRLWIAADPLTAAVRSALPPGPLKDGLSGTWLGHTLHPLLTDVPIGAWTSSLILDAVGGRESRRAADRLIAVGILAALPTAATGIAGWGDTQPKERRVGLMHAVADSTALALFSGSLLARRRGRRARGIAFSLGGAGALGIGGYLGGHLTFALGLGVDRTAFESWPEDWIDATAEDNVLEGQFVRATVNGVDTVLTRHQGEVVALADHCTHRGAPLHQGELRDGAIVCPWHQSVFRLADGTIQQGPATRPAPLFDVRVRDGRPTARPRTGASRLTHPRSRIASKPPSLVATSGILTQRLNCMSRPRRQRGLDLVSYSATTTTRHRWPWIRNWRAIDDESRRQACTQRDGSPCAEKLHFPAPTPLRLFQEAATGQLAVTSAPERSDPARVGTAFPEGRRLLRSGGFRRV